MHMADTSRIWKSCRDGSSQLLLMRKIPGSPAAVNGFHYTANMSRLLGGRPQGDVTDKQSCCAMRARHMEILGSSEWII